MISETDWGFVLHRRDYRETSLLAECFVQGRGRCAAVARGARRRGNPAGALLQPFQPLWLGLSGRGEVLTLTRSDAAGRALPLAGSALLCAFYLNELLLRLLPRQDPHDRLLDGYRETLAALATAAAPDTPLRQFELELLAALGYALTLDRTDDGAPVTPSGVYACPPQARPRPVGGDMTDAGISGATLLALARGEPLADPARRREARWLLRQALAPHLGARPLHSRTLFRQWRDARSAGPAALAV